MLPPSAGDALSSTDADLATRAARMTPQQHRVFALMAEGKPNKIIAYDMQIGEATVKAHVTEILRKMGVHSRTQAIVLAQRLALDPGAPPPAPIGGRGLEPLRRTPLLSSWSDLARLSTSFIGRHSVAAGKLVDGRDQARP